MPILDIELKSTFDDTGTKAAKKALSGIKTAVDGLEKAIGDPLTKMGNALGNAFKKGVAVAGVGIAGIGAAILGMSVKGISDFGDLQKGMNEVFTLLPGISEKAMGEMTGQVQGFNKEFGVLSEESVPALYQAISAGVPSENVFAFMETSQKAAVGGVTDLTTAIDGISSVVNAYGADVVDATRASDLMFTAVRLGKTDFTQLSSSLFNVIPQAAALGIDLGDVTAAMAVMTAQGVPTSVATTQLRQLFVELSKEGTKTSDIFKEVAGKSFKDFIASGKNTQDALQLLEKYAKSTNVGANDLFGSVEAGGAILALTGKAAEPFRKAIDEMGNSAGATDAAYATMEKGISRTLEKLQVVVADMFERIGMKMEPVFDRVTTWAGEELPGLADLVVDAFGDMADWAGEYLPEALAFLSEKLGWLKENGQTLISQGLDKLSEGFAYVKDTIIPLVQEWVPKIIDGFGFVKDELIPLVKEWIPKIVEGWETFTETVTPIVNEWLPKIKEGIVRLAEKIGPIIDTVGRLVDKFASMDRGQQDLVLAIGAVVLALPTVVPLITGLVTAISGIISIVSGVGGVIATLGLLSNPVTGAIALVGVAAGALAFAWNTDFGGIRTKTAEVANDIQNKIGTFSTSLSTKWGSITSNLTTGWNTSWGTIKTKASTITGEVVSGITTFSSTMSTKWESITSNLTSKWSDAFGSAKTTMTDAYNNVKGNLGDWKKIGEDIIRGVSNGVSNMATSATQRMGYFFGDLVAVANKAIDRGSPSRVFAAIGEDMMLGLQGGLESRADAVSGWMNEFTGTLTKQAEESLLKVETKFKDGLAMIGTTVIGKAENYYAIGNLLPSVTPPPPAVNQALAAQMAAIAESMKMANTILGDSLQRATDIFTGSGSLQGKIDSLALIASTFEANKEQLAGDASRAEERQAWQEGLRIINNEMIAALQKSLRTEQSAGMSGTGGIMALVSSLRRYATDTFGSVGDFLSGTSYQDLSRLLTSRSDNTNLGEAIYSLLQGSGGQWALDQARGYLTGATQAGQLGNQASSEIRNYFNMAYTTTQSSNGMLSDVELLNLLYGGA